jgi:hypothetical protein
MELNSICHLNCIGIILLLLLCIITKVWYLFTLSNCNKILTNLKKQCSASAFILLISLTLHMNSHLWWVHAHYSPQLLERWTCVISPLVSHTPPQEKNRWFKRSRLARSSTWSRWRLLVSFVLMRVDEQAKDDPGVQQVETAEHELVEGKLCPWSLPFYPVMYLLIIMICIG